MKRSTVVLFAVLLASPARAVAIDGVAVIVRMTSAVSAASVHALQAAVGGFDVRARWHIINGFAATMTREQARALRMRRDVAAIEQDAGARATASNARTSFGVAKAAADFGVTGDRDGAPRTYTRNDVVACIVDTGVDASHVDLDGGQVLAWQDFVNGHAAPYDDNGHGSHVAGILAGQGDGNARYRGVAPGAALVVAKALNASGGGSVADIISAVQFCVDARATFDVRILSMSLGGSGSSDGRDALSDAVNAAAADGLLPVVAAGNEGPRERSIGSPAAAASALTVCSMADPGVNGFSVSPFSSRGPTADGRVKPDVCGPGASITSVRANSTDGYVTYSGTSMATPFVAGVAALMLDADPALTPAKMKSILIGTAQDWRTPGADQDTGAGRLQGYDAIRFAGSYSGNGPSVSPHYALGARSIKTARAEDRWRFDVTSTSAPIALTLIVPNASASKDFDVYLYTDEGGSLTLLSSGETTTHQDTIGFAPTATGRFVVAVRSYAGAGTYTLDVSARAGAPVLTIDG